MALTYYDMEKLMRMKYDQKLSTSLKKDELRRREMCPGEPSQGQVACRIRPSGVAIK